MGEDCVEEVVCILHCTVTMNNYLAIILFLNLLLLFFIRDIRVQYFIVFTYKFVCLCGRVVTVAASHGRGSGFNSQSRQAGLRLVGYHPSEIGEMSSNY